MSWTWIISFFQRRELSLLKRRPAIIYFCWRDLNRSPTYFNIILFSTSKNLVFHCIDCISYKLSSFSFKSAIKNLKHWLLINKILTINFLEKSFIRIFSLSSHLRCIRQLIDLFINISKIKIVARRIRTRSIWKVIFRIIFFFNFDMLISRFKLLIFEKIPPIYILYWTSYNLFIHSIVISLLY